MRLFHPFTAILLILGIGADSKGQIPPFPESIKEIRPFLKADAYSPPPTTFTPETYQAYRKQALKFLECRAWDEKCPKIHLDLAIAAVAVGNEKDEEEALRDLLLNYGNSDEANFFLLHQDTEKIESIIYNTLKRTKKIDKNMVKDIYSLGRKVLETKGVKNVSKIYEVSFVSYLILQFHEKQDEINKDKDIDKDKKEQNVVQAKFNEKEKTNANSIYSKKNYSYQRVNSVIEDSFLEYLLTGEKKGLPNNQEKTILHLKKIESVPWVDALILLHINFQSDSIKFLLDYFYDNLLSNDEKEKYTPRLVKAMNLMEMGDLVGARKIIEPLVQMKKEPMARNLLAWSYYQEGRTKEAIEELRRIPMEFPKSGVDKYCDRFARAIDTGFEKGAAEAVRQGFIAFKAASIRTVTLDVVNYSNYCKTKVCLDLENNETRIVLEEADNTKTYWHDGSQSYINDSKAGITYESKRVIRLYKSEMLKSPSEGRKYYGYFKYSSIDNFSTNKFMEFFLNQKILSNNNDFNEFCSYTKSKNIFLKKSSEGKNKDIYLFYPSKTHFSFIDGVFGFSEDGLLSKIDIDKCFSMNISANKPISKSPAKEKQTLRPSGFFYENEFKNVIKNISFGGDRKSVV